MATAPKKGAPVDVSDQPAEGCVWMFRDGERAEVNVASGSVEVMAEQGWSQDEPAV